MLAEAEEEELTADVVVLAADVGVFVKPTKSSKSLSASMERVTSAHKITGRSRISRPFMGDFVVTSFEQSSLVVGWHRRTVSLPSVDLCAFGL